ncbi:MAG: sugar ABC transporter permease [Clostridia bacterium]|nr:sugar ABC transporter permease [Clostridia bacterium]
MSSATESSNAPKRMSIPLLILRFICGIPGVFVATLIKLLSTFESAFNMISPAARRQYDTAEEKQRLSSENLSLYQSIATVAEVPSLLAPFLRGKGIETFLRVIFGIPGALIAVLFRIPAIFVNACILLPDAAMRRYDEPLHFLRLPQEKQRLYKVLVKFCNIPNSIWNTIKKIGLSIKRFGLAVYGNILDIVTTFRNGSLSTRLSFLLMGYGHFAHGQILRGVLFALFEIVFIFYMIFTGGYYLGMLPSLGKEGPTVVYEEIVKFGRTQKVPTPVYRDNSFQILLYGVLTLFFIVAFIYTWRLNVKQNRILDEIDAAGKKPVSSKDDLRSLVDENFHRTLLALPTLGIVVFTVMPIVFMILVAFTNYSSSNDGYITGLVKWVGLDNFKTLFTWEATSGSGTTKTFAATFGEILTWTLIWAFFATFTNYFLGMLVAMAINKKGIKFKKGWRTILVMTIAIPQFISLAYVSKMFAKDGFINLFLVNTGIIKQAIDFWGTASSARITVILINIWIGIPYLMLITTGILMNIPQDLYESARIDGASGWQQYRKITLPYMLFVTGPYLLTSFTGNINNFNVIYLLTGGAPNKITAAASAGGVGETDLLITWLYKLTMGGANGENVYYLASVIGIMVFVVIAAFTLVVYRMLPSVKNEEDFQ